MSHIEDSTILTSVDQYTLSILPLDHIDADLFAIRVHRRGPYAWGVYLRSWCLSVDREWDHEPIPSERTPVWLATHRFPLGEALGNARDMLPTVVVNGLYAVDVLQKVRGHG